MKKLLCIILLLGAASVWANPMTVPQDVLTIAQAAEEPLKLRLRVFLEGPLRGGSSSPGGIRSGSQSNPITLTLGRDVSGTINPPSTVYYRFTVSTRTQVTITTAGTTDRSVFLENSEGGTLDVNFSSDGETIEITSILTAGTYYIIVGGVGLVDEPPGSYTLMTTGVPIPDIPLTLGESVLGTINLDAPNYYRFTLSTRTQVTIATTGTTDTLGILENSENIVLAFNYDISNENPNFRITRTLATGTYYIIVSLDFGADSGSYTLMATTATASDIPLTLGESVSGTINPDVPNYYRFTVSTRTLVTIASTGTADTQGILEDSAGRLVRSGFVSHPFGFAVTLEPDTYYFSIEGAFFDTGSYTLMTTGTPIPDIPLTLGEGVLGTINPDAPNYYRFTVSTRTQVTIETTGTTDTFGILDNSENIALAFNSDISNENPNFRITRTLEPGTYYILVRGEFIDTRGSYTLITTARPAP